MDAWSERLLILVVALFSNFAGSGQDKNQKIASQTVILSKGVVRLDSVLKKISRQTGFIFSYNARKVNPNITLTLTQSSYALEEILMRVTEKTGLSYSIVENHIILKPAKSQNSLEQNNSPRPSISPQKTTSSPVAKDVSSKTDSLKFSESKSKKSDSQLSESNSQVEKELAVQKNEDSIAEKEKTLKTESLQNGAINDFSKSSTEQQISNDKLKKNEDAVPTNSTNNSKIKKEQPSKNKDAAPSKKNSSFFVMTGLSFDETLYLGPSVEIGIPVLFATASYKTDFNVGMLSYGIGTSLKMQNDWRINLFATTGSTSKSYDSLSFSLVDSMIISNHRIIKASGDLLRFGLTIEKKINTRIVLQAGLLYNSLTTKYTTNGAPISIGSFGPNADKTIYAIAPAYSLSNSYKPTSDSNVKTWLGVQFSIFYVFNFSKRK